MRKYILIPLLVVLAVSVAIGNAQDAPDYNVFSSAPILTDDATTLEISLSIFNGGGAASEEGEIALRVFGEETIIVQETVAPLGANQSRSVILEFPVEALGDAAPGDLVVLEIRLNSPEIDTEQRLAEFTLPEGAAATVEGETPATDTDTTTETSPETTPSDEAFLPGILTTSRTQLENWLEILPFEVDLSNRLQLAGLVSAVLILFVLLWLVSVILRVIFSSQPTFPNHPPPYANMPQLHPESLGGRRQMWQYVAQHGAMIADEEEGNLHVRKVLLGTDGRRYSGWKVVGIRTSQYDTYGRITRSQVIGDNSMAKQLTRAIERSEDIQRDAARRRVRPVATKLARQLRRRINRKTASLPVALDIKFKGAHGEVGIQFLLYQYQLGAWRQLDSWNPEMTVGGKAIYETNTFTVFGKRPDEKMGAYRKRLREDLTALLTEMVLTTPPVLETGIRSTQETNAAAQTRVPTQQDDGGWAAPTTTSTSPAPPSEDTIAGGQPITRETLKEAENHNMDTVTHPNRDE